MSYLYQILVNGLHNGCLYAVLAYSYVLLHQVVPNPNLAHGAFFALSGQVLVLAVNLGYNALIFTFAASLGLGFLASALISLIAASVFAVLIVPRFASQAPNMMIVATLALAIVLMEAVRIGADGRDFWLPQLDTGQVQLGWGASITRVQFINMLVMALMLISAEFALAQTSAGRNIRAVAQDKFAAAFCGIDVNSVIIWTAAASAVLSMAGGFFALVHFGNMSFGAGLTYGLKVLFIAAAGGFSTPRMAALAAFCFGESESLWDGYLPIMWRETFFFAGLSLLLILRGRL